MLEYDNIAFVDRVRPTRSVATVAVVIPRDMATWNIKFALELCRRAVVQTPGKKFRIAVLGDFSAKGNAGRVEIGDKLAQRKPLTVTHENVDELLQRLDVHLQLPAGASGISSMCHPQPGRFLSRQVVRKRTALRKAS